MKKLFFSSALTLTSAFFAYGQGTGFNTTGANPNASAGVDIDFTNKGLLIPRVALTATNLAGPITSPATSLLVYNTATAGAPPNNVVPGYYSWDGGKWIAFAGTDWSLLGNAGTTAGTNFIGTTDNIPLVIKVNNQNAGKIDNTNANSFFGYLAGNSTTGLGNTAHGFQALYTNTSGTSNTANGANALYLNSTGGHNTACGVDALYTNTAGNYNTAVGENALYNATGLNNTASGYQALYANTVGNYNTAEGFQALYANVAGSNATALGHNAMQYANNTSTPFTNYNVAVGFEALRGSTTASANTGNNNTALGYQTLWSNTSGYHNTATGYFALNANSTGYQNTASGYLTLSSNNTGTDNTAFGYQGLYANTTGSFNTACGFAAGYTATSANANTIGSYNVFIGYNSGPGVPSASSLQNAIAIGKNALVNTSNSMVLGGTGADAVKVGIGIPNPGVVLDIKDASASNLSCIRITNPLNNVSASLDNNGRLYLGVGFADTYGSNDFAMMVNSTRPVTFMTGNFGIGTTGPGYKLEVNGTTACAGNVWTSDRRKKKEIQTLSLNGLDVIGKLHPVTFEWNQVLDKGMEGMQMGFIAQELELVLPTMVLTANDELKSKVVKYNELFPILVKAIQEQQEEIANYRLQIANLQTQNNNLQSQVSGLQSDVEKIKSYLDLKAQK